MGQILKIKRGNNEKLSNLVLQVGEPAFVLDTGKLYVGDGIDKVLINPDISTNSLTAEKLTNARKIALTGDVMGSVFFDGSENVLITTTQKASGVSAGTYTKTVVNEKGIVIAGTNLNESDIPVISLSKISDAGTASAKNIGTNEGEIPVLGVNGKLDVNILPISTNVDGGIF